MDANPGRPAASPASSKAMRLPHRSMLKAAIWFAVLLTALLAALAGPAGCLPLRDPRLPHHEPRAAPGERMQDSRPAGFVADSPERHSL